MYQKMNNLNENKLRRIVRRNLNESMGNGLNDAIDLIVDAYENLNALGNEDKALKYDLALSMNNLRNAVRIIRNNLYA